MLIVRISRVAIYNSGVVVRINIERRGISNNRKALICVAGRDGLRFEGRIDIALRCGQSDNIGVDIG